MAKFYVVNPESLVRVTFSVVMKMKHFNRSDIGGIFEVVRNCTIMSMKAIAE